ncbi:VanZ family protein [Hutsoniella sourekii]|uniref:VanZ family protein n=1 Tax=Hutsoniella sourekii TaxID=87650 RepID=UPI0004B5CF68|nr:VanZ family protein [Hutsoniella sourekii]
MTLKKLSYLSFILLCCLVLTIFLSSSMTYQEQSLVSQLASWWPEQPGYNYLAKIQFVYGGQPISIASSNYYAFIEFFIRKGAHFLLFGLIGALIFTWLTPYIRPLALNGFISVWLVFGYASFDELRQALNPGRSGLISDVILDTSGAITFILLSYVIIKLFVIKEDKQVKDPHKDDPK